MGIDCASGATFRTVEPWETPRAITRYGYTLMCEQTRPKELVLQARAAESAGFDFAVMSDHHFP